MRRSSRGSNDGFGWRPKTETKSGASHAADDERIVQRLLPQTRPRQMPQTDEITRLTELLAAAEAKANELRAPLDDLAGKLADAQAELAAAQDQAEAASARAVALWPLLRLKRRYGRPKLSAVQRGCWRGSGRRGGEKVGRSAKRAAPTEAEAASCLMGE